MVPENFTNTGTSGDFSARFERDLDANDRIDVNVRHELSRYLIPNEFIQQQTGQIQNGGNFETLGMAAWQRVLSPDSVLNVSGMLRSNTGDLASNTNPTPIAAFQHNTFSEGYFKATYALHHGVHDFKTGSKPTQRSFTSASTTTSPIPRNSIPAHRPHSPSPIPVVTWSRPRSFKIFSICIAGPSVPVCAGIITSSC